MRRSRLNLDAKDFKCPYTRTILISSQPQFQTPFSPPQGVTPLTRASTVCISHLMKECGLLIRNGMQENFEFPKYFF